MRKPSAKDLLRMFALGTILTAAVFWVFKVATCSRIDSSFMEAGFTALAFVGFVIGAIHQALYSAALEREMAVEKDRRLQAEKDEKNRTLRLEHDSMWMQLQAERLRVFMARGNNQAVDDTMRQMEEHWGRLSKEIGEELRNPPR